MPVTGKTVANYMRVIAICVFRNDNRILVFEGFDSVKETPFYRPIGGAVEFGETTRDAISRETREETGFEGTGFKKLGVLENIFTYEGQQCHEIVFVYDGRFVDESVYRRKSLEIHEDNGDAYTATWRNLDSFDGYHRLVPEELIYILK